MKNLRMVWKVGKQLILGSLLIMMFAMQGCKDDNPDPGPDPNPEYDPEVYQFIQELYYVAYYWNTEVDSYINITKKPPTTGHPEEYFESLKYDEKKASASDKSAKRYDRWGFMTTYLDFVGVLVEGEYKSFGYNVTNRTPDHSVRVCFVYKDSPMDKAGVKRGYQLLKLGGVDIGTLMNNGTVNTELNKETNRYVFADHAGNVLEEKTISATVVKIDPILSNTIYEVDGKKVGYIAYNTFIFSSEAAITKALQDMNDVDEFILDLRYNGGGSTAVAEAICEHLLPAEYSDSVVFAKYVFSDLTKERTKWKDQIVKIKRHAQAMNLKRMFVITASGTASASEEVINDMKPFLSEGVITVGAATHGKPVGMYVFLYPQYSDKEIEAGKLPDWAFAPITFRNDNKDDKGDYFLGIPPKIAVSDDLFNDFGVDPETLKGEGCLQAVMEYIQTGSFPTSVSVKSVHEEIDDPFQLKGLQIHAGCR